MKKYFDVIGPNEVSLLAKVKKFDIVIVQPKYDGSNVLKYGDTFYTRNLNPIPVQWEHIVRTHFPEIVKSGYNFYFEFGGRNNSPAGYRMCWSGDWDYRVLDDYEYRYHMLEKFKQEGLRVVETLAEFSDIHKAFEYALKIVNTEEMKRCEGTVVKIYGVEGGDRGLKDGVLFAKVKHDNVGKWMLALKRLSGEEELEEAPAEEIRKEIHKILVEAMTRGQKIEQIGVDHIWRQLVDELAKHGYALTPADRDRVKMILKEVKRELKRQSS